MSDKSLRFMDKTQLLNIMRQQELEIERLNTEVEKLVSGREQQIDSLSYGSEQLLAEKDAQIRKLGEELERVYAEKNGGAETMALEFEKLVAEKSEQINRLAADVSRLKSENEELAAAGSESGQAEGLLAEKDEQIERQNARIIRLTVEKDEQRKEMERLITERDELASASKAAGNKQPSQLPLENPGSLAEASLSVSGVLKAAQEAADVYLENIRLLEAEKAAEAEKIEKEAMERAEAIIREAEHKCKELEEAEKKALGDLRSVSFLYMDFIDKSHSALHDMIDKYKLTKSAHSD